MNDKSKTFYQLRAQAGGRIGGPARAAKLSPERRSEIASQGNVARIRKAKQDLLDRCSSEVFVLGHVMLLSGIGCAEVDNKPIKLTTTEAILLKILFDNVDYFVDRDTISRIVGLGKNGLKSRSLSVIICRIRKKLDLYESRGIVIKNGINGYCLKMLLNVNVHSASIES